MLCGAIFCPLFIWWQNKVVYRINYIYIWTEIIAILYLKAFKRLDLNHCAIMMYAQINSWDLIPPQGDHPLISLWFNRKPQITNFHYTKIRFNWINIPDRRYQKLCVSNFIKKKKKCGETWFCPSSIWEMWRLYSKKNIHAILHIKMRL